MFAQATLPSKPAEDDVFSFGLKLRAYVAGGLAIALVVGVGGWAGTARISGAVVSPGLVMVDQNLKAVQHRDGGIVAAINVREGDEVEAGQILFSLDDAQSRSDRAILSSQRDELMLRKARLEATRDGLAAIAWPAIAGLDAPALAGVQAGEQRIFDGDRHQRDSQTEQLRLTRTQTEDELTGLIAQRAAKQSESNLVTAEYNQIHDLAERKLVERSRDYAADRDRVRILGELGGLDSSIARTRSHISEIELQILAIDNQARTDAQKELATVETKLSELNDRLVALNDRLERTDIRAPIAGTVNELNIHTVGGVITPAQVLATIVPRDATLRVGFKLQPNNVDQVTIGQAARLRFSAFNARTTPEIDGKVSYVAAATSRDETTGASFYQGYVQVTPEEMAKIAGQKLLPGMPVEVYVTTQDRTVLSYLVKPLVDRFHHALREE